PHAHGVAFGHALLRWCFVREVELVMAAVHTTNTPRVVQSHGGRLSPGDFLSQPGWSGTTRMVRVPSTRSTRYEVRGQASGDTVARRRVEPGRGGYEWIEPLSASATSSGVA